MNHTNAYLAALAAVGVALGGPPVHAQRMGRGGGAVVGPAPVVSSASVPRRAVSTGIRAKGTRSTGTRSTGNSGNIATRQRADAFSLQDLLDLTPNNGFNYQFVNSINQDLPIKAFIDPVTQIEVAQAERLLRSTGGGFGGSYIWGGGGYYYPPEAEGGPPSEEPPQNGEQQPAQGYQPQVIVLQQTPNQQTAQSGPEAPVAEEQVPDEGEFTLVLRNGKQIEAIAFTRADDKLVYITPGGGRLSIDAADLDADATVRINQERGTPMQLPL